MVEGVFGLSLLEFLVQVVGEKARMREAAAEEMDDVERAVGAGEGVDGPESFIG